MGTGPYRQLEIWWIDLEPAKGAETQKKRPCVILQSTVVNKGSKTTIVAPILPDHKTWPFAVNITPTRKNGLDKARHINLKQLRAVDISGIQNRQGILENTYLQPIQQAIHIIFNF
ncbi:MAG: type II toxin-antitoxin system PemK/MazF family toxin [Acidobacteriota bacterium]